MAGCLMGERAPLGTGRSVAAAPHGRPSRRMPALIEALCGRGARQPRRGLGRRPDRAVPLAHRDPGRLDATRRSPRCVCRRARDTAGDRRSPCDPDRRGSGWRSSRPAACARPTAAHVALESLDLRVEPGQVIGLLGPNGAGKTTAVKLLLGLARPERGEGTPAGPAAGRPARAPVAWATCRSCSATPMAVGARGGRGSTASWPGCRARRWPAGPTGRWPRSAWSIAAGTAWAPSPRACSSGWGWASRCWATRSWSSSTSPPPRSTRSAGMTSGPSSGRPARAAPRSILNSHLLGEVERAVRRGDHHPSRVGPSRRAACGRCWARRRCGWSCPGLRRSGRVCCGCVRAGVTVETDHLLLQPIEPERAPDVVAGRGRRRRPGPRRGAGPAVAGGPVPGAGAERRDRGDRVVPAAAAAAA